MINTQLIQKLQTVFNEHIPFHQTLGYHIKQLTPTEVEAHIRMRPQLVGNFFQHTLHGGVIASVLDATGGVLVFAHAISESPDLDEETLLERIAKSGTIDLRIDYLRPGVGDSFTAKANILRFGNKVSVTRMELHNNENILIAVGTGTYLFPAAG